jgi:hypothetical protein
LLLFWSNPLYNRKNTVQRSLKIFVLFP